MRTHQARSVAVAALLSVANASINVGQYAASDIIVRDVAVIGGGASGTYAAVRLKDYGKSVVVVEQKDHFGGHVDTYTDAATGAPVDFGVLAYMNLPGVQEFFARFGIPLTNATQPPYQNIYADLSTGKVVPGYPAFDEDAINTAIGTYATIAGQYTNYLFPGFYNLPAELPEDLVLPFHAFVTKYHIEAALPFLWQFISSLDDVMNASTLTVINLFGAVHIQEFSTPGGTLLVATHNNSQLYAAAQASLGQDALLSSHVSAASRNDTQVLLEVKTATGKKLIIAKKLLFTGAPTVDNLRAFDLDSTESAIFSKWQWSECYVGLFTHTGLPDDLSITNVSPDSSAAVNNYPSGTFLDDIVWTGLPGLYRSEITAPPGLSEHQAKLLVRDAIDKLGAAGTLNTTHIDFDAFSSHSPLVLRPSIADLEAGFYQQLYSLIGRRSTYYTGSAWSGDYTSTVWLFTESAILPQILAGL